MADPAVLRAAFKRGFWNVTQAYEYLNSLPLPDYFEHPVCCPDQSLRSIEDGMVQSCRVDARTDDDGNEYLHGYTDGWDDMSDCGHANWIECEACGARWAHDIGEWD